MSFKSNIKQFVREEFPADKTWFGFTKWWLLARGYDYRLNPHQVKLVDGAGDGGIDAIALPLEDIGSDQIFVVQSKFYDQSPRTKDLERFLGAARALTGKRADYESWLETCRDDLHSLYESLRAKRKRCVFVVITSSRMDNRLRRRLGKAAIQVFDAKALRILQASYLAGRSPSLDKLTLPHSSNPIVISDSKNVRVRFFTVRVGDLAKLYQLHRELLFSGNIRYALRGATAKRVREGIDETLERYPDEFVFSHNGITIVGHAVSRRNGKVVINNPSIVNGAQTVSYFGSPRVRRRAENSRANVLVRLIEVKDQELLKGVETKVAYRSNNQNRVDSSDLMIDLPDLVSIQRYFQRNKVFLERKKGEPKPLLAEYRLSKERLVQLWAAAESTHGTALAKRKQQLFPDFAARQFSLYNRDANHRIEGLLWARVNDSLEFSIKHLDTRKARRRRAKLAQFAAIQVFERLIRDLKLKQRLLKSVKAWESEADLFYDFSDAAFKTILGHLLAVSGRDKKNEPAFYKAQESLEKGISSATRTSRTALRRLFARIYES